MNKPDYPDGFYSYRIGYEQFPIEIYHDDDRVMTRRVGSSFPTPLKMLTGQVGDRIKLTWKVEK